MIQRVYRFIANAMNVVKLLLWKSLHEISLIIYGRVLATQVVVLSISISMYLQVNGLQLMCEFLSIKEMLQLLEIN